MRCRSCNNDSWEENGLRLGNQAIVKFKDSPKEKDDYAPLDLVKCRQCGLVQLVDSVSPDRLYSQFHYLSGINQSMNDTLFDIVKEIERLIDLKPGDVVVDIGANDGTLLSYYRRYVDTVAFEPAMNITCYTADIRLGYFSARGYLNSVGNKKAKVVTAIAMFYDLENPGEFLNDVREILDDNGLFVIQMNDLDSMIQNVSVDNICHEHLTYYNKDILLPLLRKNGLYPIIVSHNNINGGSIRVIAMKNRENELIGYDSLDSPSKLTLEQMWTSFQKEKKRLLRYISKHGPIWAYGASTRGNTLLQLLGLDHTKIIAIADRNPKKWNKYTAGGNIQIISEDQMRQKQPENLLVLPYYFEEEFLKREIEYLKKGGKMIFPLPRFRIWTADKDGNLKVHGI